MKNRSAEGTYPDTFFRGLSNNTIDDHGILLPESFRLDPVRADGYCEISITWNDDETALDVIMSQISDRTHDYQFKNGIAEVDRRELDEKMRLQIVQRNLLYERRPSAGNRFHGNLLVKNSLDKAMKTMIRCQLALLANGHIYPNKYVNG